MISNTIQIVSISNGFIVRLNGEEYAYTWTDGDDREKDCRVIQELLWDLRQELIPYNKHEEWNVTIEVEKDGEIVDSNLS